MDKKEYASYWGQQVEDIIVGGCSVGLAGIVPLPRFKLLRKSLCFRVIAKRPSHAAVPVPSTDDASPLHAAADAEDTDLRWTLRPRTAKRTRMSSNKNPVVQSNLTILAMYDLAAAQASPQLTPTAIVQPKDAYRKDLVTRIRTLLNLMKITGGKYIEIGRNVAVNVANVACRSKYGRRLIRYNDETRREVTLPDL